MGGTNEQDLEELARHALAGRVARDLTHEINSLLVGVVGVATSARSADSADELRRALDECAEYGQKIAELTRAFQTAFFEGALAGRRTYQADLEPVIDRAVLLCAHRARARGARIKRTSGSLPRVQTDIAVEPILIELLHRALDQISDGAALEISVRPEREHLAITVCEPESAYVGDVSGPVPGPETSEGGRGRDQVNASWPLGLVAARAAVQRTGGELTAQSTLGKTSRFTIRFPVRTDSGR